MQSVAGGDIVKRHLRAYRILKTQLPALLIDVATAKESGRHLGRLVQAQEGIMRWIGGTSHPEITELRTKITDVLNGYIALRSGAQVTETERRMYQSIFANIGAGYKANKATITGLMTNIQRDFAGIYKETMGPEWGEYAKEVDFEQDSQPPEVWISEVLEAYELTGKSDIIVPKEFRPYPVATVVDIFAKEAEAVMKEKNLSLEGYTKSVEAQLRKEYPDLSDAEIKEQMDAFKEQAQVTDERDSAETEEPESKNTELMDTWKALSDEDRIKTVKTTIESDGAEAAKKELIKDFGLSDAEAQALIDKATEKRGGRIMPSIADQLKSDKEQEQPSNEVVSLDDIDMGGGEKRNWTTLITSFNPTKAKFWSSFNKNSWDTLEGIYDMARFYREPTQEEKKEAFSKAVREGKNLPEAQEAREALNIKWQLPNIIPTAIQIGKEILGNRPVKPFDVDIKTDDKMSKTPVLDEVLDYAKKTTGVGALLGDAAAKQEFYELVEDDPFAFYAWILPIIGQMRGVKMVGRMGKTLRGAGKTADILDVPILEAATGIGEAIARFKNRGLSPEMYNQPFEAKRGRNPKTGEDITSTVTPEEMTQRSGLETEDIPAIGMTENPSVHHREGIVGQTTGSDAAIVKQRFDKTEVAIQEVYDAIVKQADDKFPNIESFDVENVGQNIVEAYEAWQFAMRGDFRRKFDALGKVLDRELKGTDFELLSKSRKLLEELKSKPGSKMIDDPEVAIIERELAKAFETVTADGTLTLADFDALRTQFRKNVKSALRKEAIYEIGSGDPAQKMYASLTEDLYDLIENEVRLAPDDFPQGFLADVKGAKSEYRNVILMEDSLGAKFIRRNYETPHKIVEYIINPSSTQKSLNEIKTILGDEMWEGLQAGFLQRVLDVTEKRSFTWDGLKKKIADINAIDKNRLSTIFGDEKAKELAEFAEWSAKFAGEARWTKGTPTGFINKLVQEGKFSTLMHRMVNVAQLGGVGYGVTARELAPTAAALAASTIIYIGENRWNKYLNSEAGRKWMLEGHQWKVVTKNNKVITIEPGDFKAALARLKVREIMQVTKHVGKKKEFEKRKEYLPKKMTIGDRYGRLIEK